MIFSKETGVSMSSLAYEMYLQNDNSELIVFKIVLK